MEWLETHGIAMLSPSGDMPSLVNAILGSTAPGRWWSHPRGGDVYNSYAIILASPEALTTKLIRTKVTFVHKRVWQSLLNLALDKKTMTQRLALIGQDAQLLFEQVSKYGRVRLDFLRHDWTGGTSAFKRARNQLEKYGLVICAEEHTATGNHETVYRSWESFAKDTGHWPINDSAYADARYQLELLLHGEKLPF